MGIFVFLPLIIPKLVIWKFSFFLLTREGLVRCFIFSLMIRCFFNLFINSLYISICFFQPSEDKVVQELSAVRVRSSCFHVLYNIILIIIIIIRVIALELWLNDIQLTGDLIHILYVHFDMPDEIRSPASTSLACLVRS